MSNVEINPTEVEPNTGPTQIAGALPRKRRPSTELADRAPAVKKPAKEPASKTKPVQNRSIAAVELAKLKSAKGATIQVLMNATGWQAHSVRGFLSGNVKRKLGLPLVNEIGKDGQRYYRIADNAKAE